MNLKTEQPKKQRRAKAQVPADVLNDLIIQAIQDKKGLDIVKIDLRNLDEAPADFFIICNGNNENQVKAIADNIQFELKKKTNELPLHVEGERNAIWILVDYFDVVVHVFHPEARKYYKLEALWNDGQTTEYKNL